jgi:predicted ArsR family transcriptional regulator
MARAGQDPCPATTPVGATFHVVWSGQDDPDTALTALQDPVRGRLYAFVRRQPHPVTREEAATAVGISRKLAAFHLDKLITAGLLTTGRPVPPQRRGPGRAPKTYTPAQGEWQLSVPPRRYPLLAEVLAAAVTEAGESARAAAERVAAGTGRRLGQRVRAERGLGRLGPERALTVTTAVLEDAGYEPDRGTESVALRNCPFAQLAALSPELVCRINRELIGGLLEGLGASPPLQATLLPAPPGCCVQVRATRAGGPAPRRADAP